MKKNLFFDLPDELQLFIYEFNAIHRQQMKMSLHSIKNIKFCDLCGKNIIKNTYGWIWGYSNSLHDYCSEKCRTDDIDDFNIY
jgi:hypothetical protein